MATERNYPVRVEVDYPERSSRGLALLAILFWVKLLLLLPHVILLWFLDIAQTIVVIIGYWAVLFTGRYPKGMHDFVAGVLRWQTRCTAWLYGLVDPYPPFSLQ